ncbi:hypothetical protein B0H13DRAFT_1851866 [Mycena leptocephala]|nr:hypothetical protein B0H13DRAFT_1851866 [Mycena leptocephala]
MPLSLAPALASFVVITIDPVATLQALNDPIAIAAARKMTPQKYVGDQRLRLEGRLPHVAIQLTSPTVPLLAGRRYRRRHVHACVPAATDGKGRAPLRLRESGALPWSGCQQPSFMRSVVRVPVKLEDDADALILAEEDARRRTLLRDSAAKPGARSYVELSDLDECMGDFGCPIDLLDSDCTDEDEEQFYADAVEKSRPPDTMIVVNVSYDLSQLKSCPTLSNFLRRNGG